VTPGEILALFDAERRIDPAPEPGVRYEHVGNLVRAVGTWNAVVSSRLTARTADAAIAEQVAFFRSLVPEAGALGGDTGARDGPVASQDQAIEWKVYGHDLPTDLGSRLAAAGFEPDESETLMIFALDENLRDEAGAGAAPPAGVEIRRATDSVGLADFTTAACAAFERDEAWRAARMKQFGPRLTDPMLSLYVAYADGRPVASARAEFPPGRSFAGLWGGGIVPSHRGRGIYRTLVHARVEEARRRGYRYLRVDARETSRPILERLGFVSLTSITEWKFPLAAASG
jgi:GNAT superfamily N-acetyltransferase